MVPERARTPWRFTAAFVVLGIVTLATIDAVRSTNWFNRPDTDHSFLTGYGYSRLSRLAFNPDGRFIATAGLTTRYASGMHIPEARFAFCVVTQTAAYCLSRSVRMVLGWHP